MSSYVPNTPAEQREMLASLGLKDHAGLFARLPEVIRLKRALAIPDGLSEPEVMAEISRLASRNTPLDSASFLGAGSYNHFIPSIVGHVTSRPEFYTAYTPYQPEASQGALQAIFEYQTMICELTGMDASNASLYDGATAAAEAMAMCRDITGRCKLAAAGNMAPGTLEVLKTYAHAESVDIVIIEPGPDGTIDPAAAAEACRDAAGFIAAQPNYFGGIERMDLLAEAAHSNGALFTASVYPISLGLLATPGEYGADIAVGDGQPLGNHMNFGGPGFGFIATLDKYMRKLPGRITGMTSDAEGNRAFVLTLQAREQHIRREKAASNICSNQALNALAASVYLAALGMEGLRTVAELCLQKAHYACERICAIPGMKLKYAAPYFNEFVITSDRFDADAIDARLAEAGITGGLALGGGDMLYCVTEMNTRADIDRLAARLEAL